MFNKLVCLVFLILSAKDSNAETIINLVGNFPMNGGVTDVWGYTDSLNSKEYALVGTYGGIWIIEVTNPDSPQLVKTIEDVPGFDFKIWKNYLYTVTGGPGINEGIIIDLSSINSPTVAGHFNSAHNIFITPNGYLVAEIPGLKIYNLNQNPLTPQLVFDSKDEEGHDAVVIGNRLYDFHGGAGTNIYDIFFGDTLTLEVRGSIKDPSIRYHHSGWPSEDGKTLFICDELAANPFPDVTAWDISDPSNPLKKGGYIDSNATIHNLYVIGDLAYTSHYSAGFKVLDVSDPGSISVAAHYDTNPYSGDGFTGAFGVFPFSKSGNIFVSDDTGLYIFKVDNISTRVDHDVITKSYILFQNYPNPFNPSTVIRYHLSKASNVSVTITSPLGEEIKSLVNEYQSSGEKNVMWDGTNNSGNKAAQGIYLYTLKAGEYTVTKKMILLK